MATSAERQRAYKARQREAGRKPVSLLLTDNEQFYLERVLLQMRDTGAVPAMMRTKRGTLEALDA